MEDLKRKRLLLSRKNIGKSQKDKIINSLNNIDIIVSRDSFIDLEKTDLFLEQVKELEFTRTDFQFKSEDDLRRFIIEQNFPEDILFFSEHTEFCGLMNVSTHLLLDRAVEILKMPFFGGYFTIYSITKNLILEFDLDEEYNLSVYKS
ncbi:MAG: hypothetical protein ACO1O6_08380 [Bacteroidota bacterium]